VPDRRLSDYSIEILLYLIFLQLKSQNISVVNIFLEDKKHVLKYKQGCWMLINDQLTTHSKRKNMYSSKIFSFNFQLPEFS